jgi:hypothetical protein
MTTTLWRKWLRQCGGNDTNIAEETTTTLWRKQQLHWGRNDYDIAKETTRTLQRKWSRHWGGNNNDIAETMNSHRPRSQNTAKEQALIPEKESRRTWPRCHVSSEKSSKNHKPLEKWAKPNLLPDVTPQPANFCGEYFRRVCHVVSPDPPELFAIFSRHSGWPK